MVTQMALDYLSDCTSSLVTVIILFLSLHSQSKKAKANSHNNILCFLCQVKLTFLISQEVQQHH